MKQRKNKRGFTLLESLMAMVILGMAAAGVLLPFVSAAGIQQEAAHRVIAAKLASDKLEEICNVAYEDIPSRAGTELQGQVKNALGINFSDPVYSRFGRSVTCQTAAVGGVDMLWITVAVTCDGIEIMNLKTLIGP